MQTEILVHKAQNLLSDLIAIPSVSGEESATADWIISFLEKNGVSKIQRHINNVWAVNKFFDPDKPTILLNSHHDTVKPNSGWDNDPFVPQLKNGKLIGLGSNDAGAPLVSLLATFLFFYSKRDLKYNLLMAATAEEETSGPNGITSILDRISPIDFAVVGEPTAMQMASAEKGLMVLQFEARGKAGHAARNIGENAIYKAMPDIQWLSGYQFPKISKMLGPVKMSVTIIEGGTQHNVIPDSCRFTVDIRTTDVYSHDEILETIQGNVGADLVRCSLRLNPSGIADEHELVKTAGTLGIGLFGSPTLSDQAVLNIPSVKIGPGMSERSHTAGEFIYLEEIKQGIETYIKLFNKMLKE